MKRSGTKIGIMAAVLLLAAAASGCMSQSQPRNQQNPANPQAQGGTDNITEGTGNIQQDADRSNSAQNNPKPREAQHIAQALAGKYTIGNSYVYVVDSTAFVACDINDKAQGQLSDAVKNEIGNEVRRVDPSIQRVYVSADPNVIQQFRNFGNVLRGGQPVQGITSQFTDMVRRIWPEAK